MRKENNLYTSPGLEAVPLSPDGLVCASLTSLEEQELIGEDIQDLI